MPLLPARTQPSYAEKDALIAALTARVVLAAERIAARGARIGVLEARLDEPARQLIEAAMPGQKEDLPASAADRPPRKKPPRCGPNAAFTSDLTIDRLLSTCPKCEAVFPDASQTAQQVYERIELPTVRRDVTQARLFGGRCACGERAPKLQLSNRFQFRPPFWSAPLRVDTLVL